MEESATAESRSHGWLSISQRPRTAPDRGQASLFTSGDAPDPNLRKGRQSESEPVFKPKDEEAIAVKWARDDVEAEKKLGTEMY